MADIFLARVSSEFGASKLVVVKQILPKFSGDDGFARLLSEEAKLAAQLGHANVVHVFDLGTQDGRLFIAMEYVEGFDLNRLLVALTRADLPLPAEFAFFIACETLRALDYAHRARSAEGVPLGIVHRDVSPSNVLVSFEGEVKLCDFGIARAFGRTNDEGEAESRVRQSRLVGKSAYMAPEHARAEAIDARADVFAAGILLWELCAGRRMYRGTETEILQQARVGEAPELPDRGLPNPHVLEAILRCALSPDPDHRYATAGEFLRAIDGYATSSRLAASQLKFAAFLREHFAEAIVGLRRERECAAHGLDEALKGGLTSAVDAASAAPPIAPVSLAPPTQASRRVPDEEAAIVSRPIRAWVYLLVLGAAGVGAVLGTLAASWTLR